MPRASALLMKVAVVSLVTEMLFLATAQEARPVLSEAAAVELAEAFVRENGYTDAPESAVKAQLDAESIESSNQRAERLKARRNTLRPRAIGMKTVGEGWGVAFAYVAYPGTCRVVTMRVDGTGIRIQHEDGIRDYWLGFSRR